MQFLPKGFLAIAAFCLLFGCTNEATPLSRYGQYTGIFEGMVELIILKEDGHYLHEVYFDGQKVISEKGSFSFGDDSIIFDEFTEMYDHSKRKVTREGLKFSTSRQSFTPDGGFYVIVSSDNSPYFLRQEVAKNRTEPAK